MRKSAKFILIFISLMILTSVIIMPEVKNYSQAEGNFIKWVDCNVSYEILQKCYELDVNSKNSTVHYDFIELLAYIAVKNGNKFNYKKDSENLNKLIARLNLGEKLQDFLGENKYYKYYHEAYTAIFGEFIGDFIDTNTNEIKYGLKTYYPFAKGYWGSGSDDFGNSRSYGFRRVHLGHDIFGSIGTPIIAVEGGYVAEIGWNRFGGWRIGIRSNDKKRYYYYAHLRKGKPYIKDLKKGDKIEAGQVIGYLGVTGYSFTENKNMNTKPHLHFGLQLIFDESQVDGNGEIWIDVYNICRFLTKNKAQVIKDNESGDFKSENLRKSIAKD